MMTTVTRDRILSRDGYRCQLRFPGCTGRAEAVHHVVHKGMGGRHGLAKIASEADTNLVASCRACHIWEHDKQILRSG